MGREIYDSGNKKGTVGCNYGGRYATGGGRQGIGVGVYSNLIILSFMFRPLDIILKYIFLWLREFLITTGILLKYLFRRNNLNLIRLCIILTMVWIKKICCENSLNSVTTTHACTGNCLVEKITLHQSVEIRVVIRTHYLLIMNLNAINQTWSYVNKNTQFSRTKISDLIKAFKMLHRLLVSEILSTNKKATFSLYRFDRGWCFTIFLSNEICRRLFYVGFPIFWQTVTYSMGAKPSKKWLKRKKL